MAMGNLCLSEDFKVATALVSSLGNVDPITFDNISMKDAIKVWCVIQFSNGTGDIVTVNPLLGANVTTCATVPTFNIPFWYNADTVTSDTLVAPTWGTTFATGAGGTAAMVVFQIDPTDVINQGPTLDCIGCTITGGATVGNHINAIWIVQERYAQATPRSIITN